MEKVNLIKGSVQETMLGPLWARAKFSKLYPEILDDQKAYEIIEKLDYDFSKVQEYLGEWRGIGLLVRAKNFDNALKDYIERFPNSTIVNIGAGLDTTFFRVDNGKIKWYDLDLSDAIEFRRQYIPETIRCKYISKSALDYSWFDEIDFSHDKGIFLIAGGFIYYFQENEISAFFRALAGKFPDGELIFDCVSNLAIKVAHKRAKKAGVETPFWHIGIGDPIKKIAEWSDNIKVIDWYTMYSRVKPNPKWNKKTVKMVKIAERFKTAKIVHVKFLK
ncbi:MAG: class I SAM-dependent methyltransferase [Candidatus Lokiarchaeota archaeon]|nr:class I SAM-dependent methyltransferase [Candidatus Lokiarchaeota archaeon]